MTPLTMSRPADAPWAVCGWLTYSGSVGLPAWKSCHWKPEPGVPAADLMTSGAAVTIAATSSPTTGHRRVGSSAPCRKARAMIARPAAERSQSTIKACVKSRLIGGFPAQLD